MELVDLVKAATKDKASDLYLAVNAKPLMKVHGVLKEAADEVLNKDSCKELIYKVLNESQIQEFEKCLELNCALWFDDVGRYRLNLYLQQGVIGAVLRRIEEDIPKLEDLDLPSIITSLSMARKGLVLVVGATGSGKSTTLAAMIGNRNRNDTGHIITIEDPIEFIHKHESCIVSQREIGIDTLSLKDALTNTLRQAPDVILIGEIRTKETMEYALHFAETGHLCLATLHATNATQALERIVSFFPKENREQVFMEVSENLRGIIAQRLIIKKDGKGRAAAVEVLINSPAMTEHIKSGSIDELKDLIERSKNDGMVSMDSSVFSLYKSGVIGYDQALRASDSENNFRLMAKLNDDSDKSGSSLDGISII